MRRAKLPARCTALRVDGVRCFASATKRLKDRCALHADAPNAKSRQTGADRSPEGARP